MVSVQREVDITPFQKTYVVPQAGCHPHCKTLGETGGSAGNQYGDYFPILENFPQYSGLKNLVYRCLGDGCVFDDRLLSMHISIMLLAAPCLISKYRVEFCPDLQQLQLRLRVTPSVWSSTVRVRRL